MKNIWILLLLIPFICNAQDPTANGNWQKLEGKELKNILMEFEKVKQSDLEYYRVSTQLFNDTSGKILLDQIDGYYQRLGDGFTYVFGEIFCFQVNQVAYTVDTNQHLIFISNESKNTERDIQNMTWREMAKAGHEVYFKKEQGILLIKDVDLNDGSQKVYSFDNDYRIIEIRDTIEDSFSLDSNLPKKLRVVTINYERIKSHSPLPKLSDYLTFNEGKVESNLGYEIYDLRTETRN